MELYFHFILCTISSTDEDKRCTITSGTKNRGHLPRMPPDRRPRGGSALSGPSASGRAVMEEHGGYYCAGCNQSWSSLRSLTYHRASPYMRGTACGEEISSRELRNIYRSHLATGQDSRPHILSAGILGNKRIRIHPPERPHITDTSAKEPQHSPILHHYCAIT